MDNPASAPAKPETAITAADLYVSKIDVSSLPLSLFWFAIVGDLVRHQLCTIDRD
jgi:hypothetical protein